MQSILASKIANVCPFVIESSSLNLDSLVDGHRYVSSEASVTLRHDIISQYVSVRALIGDKGEAVYYNNKVLYPINTFDVYC